MQADELDRELLLAMGRWAQAPAPANEVNGILQPMSSDERLLEPALTNESRSSGGASGLIQVVLASPSGAVKSSGWEADSAEAANPSSMPAGNSAEQQYGALTATVDILRATTQQNVEALAANTQVLTGTAQKQSDSGVLSTIGNVLGTIGSGLTLWPLISGLAKLFGGGDAPGPEPLAKYAAPAPINLEAGVSGQDRSLVPVDYGEGGSVRAVQTYAPQITVQVSAMDSRSFSDHSDEIARAVREAMLASHPINDVVSEL